MYCCWALCICCSVGQVQCLDRNSTELEMEVETNHLDILDRSVKKHENSERDEYTTTGPKESLELQLTPFKIISAFLNSTSIHLLRDPPKSNLQCCKIQVVLTRECQVFKLSKVYLYLNRILRKGWARFLNEIQIIP